MKHGFILIEVLLAAAIASIIGVALFASLYQITRFSSVVDTYADIWTKAATVHRQLERDLLGAFVPLLAENETKNGSYNANQEEKDTAESKQKQEFVGSKKEQTKKINKVFYGVNKDIMLDTLTFITNNPMQGYWSAKTGKAKPRIARVVYRLTPDKRGKNTYILFRQEGNDLYYDAYKEGDSKEIRQYPIAEDIKEMIVSYGVVDKQEKDTAQKAPESDKKSSKKSYKIIKEWKKEEGQKKEEVKDKKQKTVELPAFVLIKLTLWDEQKKKDVYFEFKIPLIAEGKPVPAVIQEQQNLTLTPTLAQPHLQLPSNQRQEVTSNNRRRGSNGILSMIPGFSTSIETGRVEFTTVQQSSMHSHTGISHAQ